MAHAHTEGEGPPWRQPAPTTPLVRRFPTEGRSMSEQPRARAVAGQRAAGGRRSAREGVAPATLNPHIHRRGTHGRKWLTPSHRAGTAVIADLPHIRNKPGPYWHVPKFLAGAGSTASGHREPRCETPG